MLARGSAISWLLLVTASVAAAERLPTRTFALADGLPSTFVDHITPDARGLLWFATRDGLARFDGARFVTYGVDEGLPISQVTYLLQSRSGEYWVATNGGGLCRMSTDAVSESQQPGSSTTLFQCISLGQEAADRVNALAEDPSGRLWIGTDAGLYRLKRDSNGGFTTEPVVLDDPLDENRRRGVSTLLATQDGAWVGTARGLLHVGADGRLLPSTAEPHARGATVRGIGRASDGTIWVAYQRGLLRLHRSPHVDSDRWFAIVDGEILENAVHVAANGHIWAGTNRGLLEFDGQQFRRYQSRHGLPERLVSAVAEDRDRNLWIATMAGVVRMSPGGFVSYGEPDGLAFSTIHALFEDAEGDVYVVGGNWAVSRFDGSRFVSVEPQVPGDPRWAGQLAFLDRAGAWWMLGGAELARYATGQRFEEMHGKPPRAVYRNQGSTRPGFLQLYEDLRGDVWWSAAGDTGQIGRWDRAADRFTIYPEAQGQVSGDRASAFGEDASGSLWIGFYQGGLLRYNARGFQRISGPDAPLGMITAIHRDRRGRLWIGSNRDGLTRVDDPTAEHPRFTRYARGESSSNVRCIVSDAKGYVYVGTARGVDRVDPSSGAVRHYTTDDGLANGFVTVALSDSHERLWFGTLDGLSQLRELPEPVTESPTTWIEGWRVNGTPRPVSHLGQASIAGVELAPDQNQVQIDFYGIGSRQSGALRYQYQLEGVGTGWSTPSAERVVHYSGLAAGRYRFQVRAVSADGGTAATPAEVQFEILPRVWQRWWFRGAALLVGLLTVLTAHRYRVSRLLETERVRTRIASDLHDDLGSNLSQIAILSEVARATAGDGAAVGDPLRRIATLSRESVDAMGDIVWAIDPHRDTSLHLAQRLRRIASDLLPAHGVDVHFDVAESRHCRLGADVRREVFLIFKETIHNIVRHANATRADVSLTTSPRTLHLIVQDNGRGFDPATAESGQGLRNLSLRAQRIGGAVTVTSATGAGARVALTVHL